MSKYLVIIEKAEANWAAYVPNLPRCVATGTGRDETLHRMRGAIAMHLEGIRADGGHAPEPSSTAEYVSI